MPGSEPGHGFHCGSKGTNRDTAIRALGERKLLTNQLNAKKGIAEFTGTVKVILSHHSFLLSKQQRCRHQNMIIVHRCSSLD